jgi:hypothetical protein
VRRLFHTLVKKNDLRRFFAGMFLVFLLAEWGSHGVIYSHSSFAEGQAMAATDREHEDPCRTLIICSDPGRKDHAPNLWHDATPHNALFDHLSQFNRLDGSETDPHSQFATINGPFRPPSPPFHPPELS